MHGHCCLIVFFYTVMPITVYINMCELGTLGQATKSRIAKPNSDHGKSVKATINSLIYRRGRGSQSTVFW